MRAPASYRLSQGHSLRQGEMAGHLMSRPVNEKAYLLKVDLETGEPVWTTVY